MQHYCYSSSGPAVLRVLSHDQELPQAVGMAKKPKQYKKPHCGQGFIPFEASGGESFLASSSCRWLQGFLALWLRQGLFFFFFFFFFPLLFRAALAAYGSSQGRG